MASSSTQPKRRKVVHKRPNPLFEEWLTEWRDEAKEKGWQIHYTYSKALKALKLYPVPMKSANECKNLKNFGDKLCSMLDKRLAEYIRENPDDPRLAALNNTSAVPQASTSAEPSNGAPRKRAPASPKKRKAPANKNNNGNGGPGVSIQSAPPVFIPAGQAQVKLLVDSSETSAASTKSAARRATLKELQVRDVPFEIRDLSVGDFMWLVISPDGSELVLPYVVERKRSDDLAHSIKGTRYKEQKMRLKNSGLNIIYLIEATAAHLSLAQETLYQAQTNTEIIDKFCVHNTANVKETVSYLTTMTTVLQRKVRNKNVASCGVDEEPEYSPVAPTLRLYTFLEVQNGSAKIEDFTVREMFAQHLLQISGVTGEAASAIVKKYPTLALMREAFSKCISQAEKIGLLTVLQFGSNKRSLPNEVARRIVQFYTEDDFSNL